MRTVQNRLQVKFGWKAIVCTVLKGERKSKEPKVQERVLVESGGWEERYWVVIILIQVKDIEILELLNL